MLSMTMFDHPVLPAPSWASVRRVAPALWRVIDPRGRVVGHVRTIADDGGWRYRAERFHAARREFLRVGEFAAGADALESLRT